MGHRGTPVVPIQNLVKSASQKAANMYCNSCTKFDARCCENTPMTVFNSSVSKLYDESRRRKGGGGGMPWRGGRWAHGLRSAQMPARVERVRLKELIALMRGADSIFFSRRLESAAHARGEGARLRRAASEGTSRQNTSGDSGGVGLTRCPVRVKPVSPFSVTSVL